MKYANKAKLYELYRLYELSTSGPYPRFCHFSSTTISGLAMKIEE